mmetsp:Transcript_4664/g.12753  ORF Transcript_4664/g.12753 Transcript_4664/m.12753 type:complete len:214 (-) Transcript_4664:141-782(-)
MCTSRMASFFIRDAMARTWESGLKASVSVLVVRFMISFRGLPMTIPSPKPSGFGLCTARPIVMLLSKPADAASAPRLYTLTTPASEPVAKKRPSSDTVSEDGDTFPWSLIWERQRRVRRSHVYTTPSPPKVSNSLPSGVYAAQRAEPFIFRLATHCLLASDTRGTYPWSPRKATVLLLLPLHDAGGAAKDSRLFRPGQPDGPCTRSTLPCSTL